MLEIRRIANLLVARYALSPPVDVHRLAGRFADLEFCDWPFDCDGVAVLSRSRPRIFIKKTRNRLRERFTVAHELGHVVIGWHLDNVSCHIDPQNAERHALTLGIDQEAEANRFASHLLLPDNFLAPFAGRYVSAPDALRAVAAADTSAAACVIALARVLLPGYVFVVPTLNRPVTSSGTKQLPPDITQLRKISRKSGSVVIQGQQIQWFQLVDSQSVRVEPISPPDTRRILLTALREVRPHEDAEALATSINGIVGGTLSKPLASRPEDIMGILVYKFSDYPEYADIVKHPGFDHYLQLRSIEVARIRTGRGAS
jgi:hypothetical protein